MQNASDLLTVTSPRMYLLGLVSLWVFSAAISAMKPPTESSSPKYQWFFRFIHLLAANLDRAGVLSRFGS